MNNQRGIINTTIVITILAIVILIEIGYLMRNVKEIQSVLTFWVFLAIFLTGHFAFPILMNVPSMEDNGDSINAYTIKAAFGHKKPVQENGLKANYFGEVRDRDYFFIASYMIYALWMGLGAGVLIKWLHNEANKKGNITSYMPNLSKNISVFLNVDTSVIKLFFKWICI